jgi:hypothetical protein
MAFALSFSPSSGIGLIWYGMVWYEWYGPLHATLYILGVLMILHTEYVHTEQCNRVGRAGESPGDA